MLRFILLIMFGMLGFGLAMNTRGVQNDLRAISESLTFHGLWSFEPMGELFEYGSLLPWFVAVSIASTLVLRRLSYWTTPLSICFSGTQSFVLLHPAFQWEGTTFVNTIPHVIVCLCSVPISIASINISSALRDIRQVRWLIRDFLTAAVFVAMLFGAIVAHSGLGVSLAMLATSTWIAYATALGQNTAGRTKNCSEVLERPF